MFALVEVSGRPAILLIDTGGVAAFDDPVLDILLKSLPSNRPISIFMKLLPEDEFEELLPEALLLAVVCDNRSLTEKAYAGTAGVAIVVVRASNRATAVVLRLLIVYLLVTCSTGSIINTRIGISAGHLL